MNTVYNNLEVVHSTARLDRIRCIIVFLPSSIGLILDTAKGELGADESKFELGRESIGKISTRLHV